MNMIYMYSMYSTCTHIYILHLCCLSVAVKFSSRLFIHHSLFTWIIILNPMTSIYLFIHSFICQTIYPFIHPFVHPIVHLSIHSFINLFIHSSIHSSIHSLINHPSIHLLINRDFHKVYEVTGGETISLFEEHSDRLTAAERYLSTLVHNYVCILLGVLLVSCNQPLLHTLAKWEGSGRYVLR